MLSSTEKKLSCSLKSFGGKHRISVHQIGIVLTRVKETHKSLLCVWEWGKVMVVCFITKIKDSTFDVSAISHKKLDKGDLFYTST